MGNFILITRKMSLKDHDELLNISSLSEKLFDADSDSSEDEKKEEPQVLPPRISKIINKTSVETRNIGKRIARIKKIDDTHTNVYNLTELHEMGDKAVAAFEEINMDEMLEYVGHEGRYQYTLIALAAIMSMVMSMI